MKKFLEFIMSIFGKKNINIPTPIPETQVNAKEEIKKEIPLPTSDAPQETKYLALVIGHTHADGGADGVSPLNMQEYVYNTEVASIAKKEATNFNVEIEVFFRDIGGVKGAYSLATKWLESKINKGAIIELHFNAANKAAVGTETVYADKNDEKGVNEKLFAQIIQDEMCQVFGRTGKENRGLEHLDGSAGERGYQNMTQTIKYPSILVEPFFGDVESEAKLAVEKQKEYAICLIKGFLKFKGV